jgi:hypothetical protein
MSVRLRKWEAACSHVQVLEALRTVIEDCKVAADRIEELEALLRSVHGLVEAVYGYHHAQGPGLRCASERHILSMLDSISLRCEAVILKEKHGRPVAMAG